MQRGRVVLSIMAIALVAVPSAAHAQNAEAEALFNEGDALMKQGKLTEACEAFEASNRLESRAGTLIRLGECREKNRQLASAWSAYKDALTRAKDPKKRDLAIAKVAELEPQLSYLTISVADSSRVDGLELVRNGERLDPALWNRASPMNGGSYVIGARAPGKQEWKTTVSVPADRGKVTVAVPKLADLNTPIVQEPVPPVPPVTTPPEPEEPPATASSTFTPRRKVAVVAAGAAVLAVSAGVVLGMQARSKEDEAFALCPDPTVSCNDAVRANELIDAGRSRALGANVAFGVAGAAAIGAAVLWLTGAPQTETSVALVPSTSTLTVVGRF